MVLRRYSRGLPDWANPRSRPLHCSIHRRRSVYVRFLPQELADQAQNPTQGKQKPKTYLGMKFKGLFGVLLFFSGQIIRKSYKRSVIP
jgi:hypothetical protein